MVDPKPSGELPHLHGRRRHYRMRLPRRPSSIPSRKSKGLSANILMAPHATGGGVGTGTHTAPESTAIPKTWRRVIVRKAQSGSGASEAWVNMRWRDGHGQGLPPQQEKSRGCRTRILVARRSDGREEGTMGGRSRLPSRSRGHSCAILLAPELRSPGNIRACSHSVSVGHVGRRTRSGPRTWLEPSSERGWVTF